MFPFSIAFLTCRFVTGRRSGRVRVSRSFVRSFVSLAHSLARPRPRRRGKARARTLSFSLFSSLTHLFADLASCLLVNLRLKIWSRSCFSEEEPMPIFVCRVCLRRSRSFARAVSTEIESLSARLARSLAGLAWVRRGVAREFCCSPSLSSCFLLWGWSPLAPRGSEKIPHSLLEIPTRKRASKP